MTSPIPAVYKSMIREVTDFIEILNGEAIVSPDIEYHNWESRNDENDLPATTLIGLDGFSFDPNDGRWIVRVALAISSYRDINLLNEIDLIGRIHERFGENQKIILRDLSTGDEENELVITNFNLFPMAQSELRNYRTIGLELNRTGR